MSGKICLTICLAVVALVLLYLAFKPNEPQQIFPSGTQIEHTVEIEVDQGYERHEVYEKHWSIGK
jgi:hypothetical protein